MNWIGYAALAFICWLIAYEVYRTARKDGWEHAPKDQLKFHQEVFTLFGLAALVACLVFSVLTVIALAHLVL